MSVGAYEAAFDDTVLHEMEDEINAELGSDTDSIDAAADISSSPLGAASTLTHQKRKRADVHVWDGKEDENGNEEEAEEEKDEDGFRGSVKKGARLRHLAFQLEEDGEEEEEDIDFDADDLADIDAAIDSGTEEE